MANNDEAQDNWLGFSCPECHTLFRVPPHCVGKQVECPSCSEIVVIPGEGAGEGPSPTLPRSAPPISRRSGIPPEVQKRQRESRSAPEGRPANQFRTTEEAAKRDSVVPQESVSSPEEDRRLVPASEWDDRKKESQRAEGTRRVRRKVKKKPVAEPKEYDWESEREPKKKSRSKMGMQTLVLAGIAILIFFGGVLTLIILRDKGPKPVKTPVERRPDWNGIPAVPPLEVQYDSETGDSDLTTELKLIEQVVNIFLNATSVEDLAAVSRGGEETVKRMRSFYQGKPPAPIGYRSVAPDGRLMTSGELWAVDIELADFSKQPIAFEKTANGYLVDWESWVGYSELSWEEMRTLRPTEPKLFRARLSLVEYYNFGFTDTEWRAYRAESPDGLHVLYAYVPRASIQESMLGSVKAVGARGSAFVVKLCYPKDAKSGNQVLLVEVVESGWVAREEKREAKSKSEAKQK